METASVSSLIEAGVHFGCRVSRWNPKMAPYIYGRRNLIHIIDLRQTLRGIVRAQNVLYHLAAEGSSVLWVGTKRQVRGVIAETGERTGMPTVTERWIGGTLTNFSVIRSRLRRLEELERMEEDGTISQYSKKMIASLRRERRKITRNLGGIREMTSIPGAMVVVDPAREYNSVREARKMGLVVIGLLDTDCDPSQVDIVIPGNDDALKAVRLLVEQLAEAVEEGCANHRESLAAAGAAELHEDDGAGAAEGGDPRPTRPLREIPPLVRLDGADGEPDADGASATPPEATSESAPAAAAPASAPAPEGEAEAAVEVKTPAAVEEETS
ncbi:MAG: 30S ribosomal protein S2 [Planctomycetota bacterium]|jgi:small subunit ribosomal protein S2|nr:30S ribosomal protein S2 [Planctomycetota bacterium]